MKLRTARQMVSADAFVNTKTGKVERGGEAPIVMHAKRLLKVAHKRERTRKLLARRKLQHLH